MISKLKKFKVIPIMTCLLAVIIFSSVAYATEVPNDGNVGVSFTPPSTDSDVMPYTTSIPKDVWDVKSDGQYDFGGWSYGDDLYTNYKFKGKTSYSIYVNNTGSSTITIKAKTRTKTYASTTLAAGEHTTLDLSGMKKDTEFYIKFSSKSEYHFSGNIK